MLLSIDTPTPAAMEVGLSLAQTGKPLANSITQPNFRAGYDYPMRLASPFLDSR